MDPTTRLVFHIGLHKTGSTTLQQSIFPRLGGIAYLGRGQLRSLTSVFTSASYPVLLYSDETILGRLVDVYKTSRAGRPSWPEMQIDALQRLGRTYPHAAIIIGLRRYDDLLLSIYKHYLRYGGNLAFSQFFTQHNNGLIAPDDLLFAPRISAANNIFPGRVYVYFLEDLLDSPQRLIEEMATFIGASIPDKLEIRKYNEGVSRFEADLIRRLNCIPLYSGTDHPDRNGTGAKLIRRLRLSPYKISKRIARLLPRSEGLMLNEMTSRFLNQYYAEDKRATSQLLLHEDNLSPCTLRTIAPLAPCSSRHV